MSALSLATWAAVVVLVAGSAVIFAWYLAELLRGRRRRAPGAAGDGREESGATGSSGT